MANDGRVSGVQIGPEYVPTEVGHVSGVQVEPEYVPTVVGHVSGVQVDAEYMPTFIGHESALYLMVEYEQAPLTEVPLVQGEEQLQMIQFQGSEQQRGPGQVT